MHDASTRAGATLGPPRSRPPRAPLSTGGDARRQLALELVSGGCGAALALFMWGHMLLVGSILTGTRGFNWIAGALEDYFIAQPTVVAVLVLFLVHAALAARKLPSRLADRRRMLAIARGLRPAALSGPAGEPGDPRLAPHFDSLLWIWQVRTGMVVLVLGSFHVLLLGLDVLTPVFGERAGIEAATSMARVAGGLWPLYAVLLLCVEFHAGVGLFRLALKWGAGARIGRALLHRLELVVLVVFLGVGVVALAVLAGWLEPPLAFLLAAGPATGTAS